MTIKSKFVTTAGSVLILGGLLGLLPVVASAEGASVLEAGKKAAFDRKRGNCLACHVIAGGELAGNIGPPLIAMKARFPDRAKLREQIYDSTKANPDSMMPPFGPHGIISDKEIDDIIEFIYTL